MATKLNKSLVRETTIKKQDKELIVTLTDKQGINLKLKGVRGTKGVDISISDLYDQLNDVELGNSKYSQRYPDDLLVPIEELRAEILTSSKLTYEEKVKFSISVRNVIDDTIKRIKAKNEK
jgi:hypothetical protein